jgi:hypothetical protein
MQNEKKNKGKSTNKRCVLERENCFLLLWDGANNAIDVVMALYDTGWSYENSMRIMRMSHHQNAIIRYGNFHDLSRIRHKLNKFQLKTTIVRISSFIN